jgi:hypothetical protein
MRTANRAAGKPVDAPDAGKGAGRKIIDALREAAAGDEARLSAS